MGKYAVVKKHHESRVYLTAQSGIDSCKNVPLIFHFSFLFFSQQPSSTFSVSLNWISLVNWSHFISRILNLKNNGEIGFLRHVELIQGFFSLRSVCHTGLRGRCHLVSLAFHLQRLWRKQSLMLLLHHLQVELQQLRFERW